MTNSFSDSLFQMLISMNEMSRQELLDRMQLESLRAKNNRADSEESRPLEEEGRSKEEIDAEAMYLFDRGEARSINSGGM